MFFSQNERLYCVKPESDPVFIANCRSPKIARWLAEYLNSNKKWWVDFLKTDYEDA